jgi:hypothetical protein
MVTSENSIDAEVLFSETEQGIKSIFTGNLIQENRLIITQGFIGKSVNGLLSTIGREGSDYTAILLSIILGTELNFWKKRGVDGNPERISLEKFMEIEKKSEKSLLSSKGLNLLMEYKKTFRINNFDNPYESTVVG